MCGIAGLFLPDGPAAESADLAAMMSSMTHRGPDGRNTWTAPDRRYQAAFVRLAIIDLATGTQPLVEKDGARVLTGNGEIYNYRELRAQYADYPYQTQGDMEAALAASRVRGEDFVHDLNGMYGIALYERDDHRLTLIRDRLGVKPLYWARTPAGGIVYASEIKALFASDLIRPRVDEESVSSYLSHGWVPAPKTLFAGVNKLPPGHRLIAGRSGDIRIERYWRPTAAADLPDGEAAIAEYLTELLEDAVSLQLRSDVPVGALLSGGIDSGLMVALAARRSDRPIKTYTVRFEGAPVDESPLAAAVARQYGTEHLCVDLPAADVGVELPRLAWHCEEPLFDAALLPNDKIEQVLGAHVRVALNGTGGDELFAGYGRHFPMPVEQRYLKAPAWLRQGVIEPLADRFDPMTGFRLKRAALHGRDRGQYLHDHITQFPAPARRLIGNRMIAPIAAQCAAFSAFRGPADSAQLAAELETYLPDDLLVLLDRTSMAWSVEGRVPFLDHRLVEAALAVPPDIRAPGGRQKGLERLMAKRFLPEQVLAAPKQGFASPVPAWMKGGLGATAKRVLTRRIALERGWWTAGGIEHLFADPDRHAFRLYTLLMLELAVRIHVDGRPPDPLEAFADGA